MENVVVIKILNKKIKDLDELIIVVDGEENIKEKRLFHEEKNKLILLMFDIIGIMNKEFDLTKVKDIDLIYLDVIYDMDFNINFKLSEKIIDIINKEQHLNILGILDDYKKSFISIN